MVDSYAMTDVGKVRSGNEDDFVIDDTCGVYVVSDGMGGHQAGEVASQLVVTTIRDYIKQYRLGERDEKVLRANYDNTLSEPANIVYSGIKLANKIVFNMSQRKANCKGMGATAVVLAVFDDRIITANVGDSRVYLIRGNHIECLSNDHTLAYDQLREELIREDEFEKSPYKHVLTRAVGVEEDVEPEVCEFQALPGDRFLLCSDGLTNMVDDSKILEVVTYQNIPEKICRKLVGIANKNGGLDNITVLLLHFVNGRFYWLRSLFSKLFRRG
ncbi:MAG: Stp1/IreP family PP2C-type Ser/Thr phosphatase [Pseudomonadota bacterium]